MLFRTLLSFCLVCALLAGVSSAYALEQVALQLKWTHAFQFAGYYMAKEKGFYREAGLDVEIRQAAPETDVVDEVVSDRAQFGVGTSSLLLARGEGRPVVALAVIFQHSPVVLISRHGDGLHGIRDLVGKKVMMERHVEDLLAYLRLEQVPTESLTMLPHSFSAEDLLSGRVDAMSAYLTSEPFNLQRGGLDYSIFSPRSAGIDFYGDNLFTSERELQLFPSRVAAFRAASLRGWEYAMTHVDETIGLILSRYTDKLSADFLRFEASQMRLLIVDELVGIGYMHPGRWRHIAETYAAQGMLAKDFPIEDFLYDPDSRSYLSRLSRYLVIALGIALVLGIFAGYVVRINRRLRHSQHELETQAGRLRLHAEVLELLNRDQSLESVLSTLVRGFEKHYPDTLCSVVILNEAGTHIRRSIAPALPAFYNEALIGLEIGEGRGSCGTAAARGERVVVEDIRKHPYWQAYLPLVEKTRLRACWSQPVKGSDGRVLGTFAVYQEQVSSPTRHQIDDIENYANLAAQAMERASAQLRLRDSEQRYRLIAENSSDVIWTLELPGLQFSFVSPSVERLRGWTAAEVMAQTLAEALVPAAYERVLEILGTSLRRVAEGDMGARFARIEIEQPCKDGSKIPTEVVTNLVLDDSGQPLRIIGITRDIRERRKLEQAQQNYRDDLERTVATRTEALTVAKEAAEIASVAKSQFIANISHELRTPMNGILGMIDIVRRRGVSPEVEALLGRQEKAGRELLTLINNLIDVAAISTGDPGKILKPQTFSVTALVQGVMAQHNLAAERKGLALSVEVDASLVERSLWGDPLRIGQVLDNLIDNAIKFSERGRIELSVQPYMGLKVPAIRFAVHDQGCGVPLQNQRRIFSLFEQGDGSATRRYGGTGLGLGLCKQLVEMMGGEIGVSSDPGRGSLFWFYLPTVEGAGCTETDA